MACNKMISQWAAVHDDQRNNDQSGHVKLLRDSLLASGAAMQR
jgi:hypothetical protein